MSGRPSKPGKDPSDKRAHGAARETIGKLLGDDAEIRKGRQQQKEAATGADAPPASSSEKKE